jgi:hypothetical protein
MLDTIYEGMAGMPEPPVKPPLRTQGLPQGLAAEQAGQSERAARKLLARQAQGEASDLKLINKAGDADYKVRREETLAPLQDARNEIAQSAKLGSESLYMAALLAGTLPGSGLAAKMTAGSRIGRGLAGRKGQEFLGGQTEWQKNMADALREGKTEQATRIMSRVLSRDPNEEENR